MPLTPTSCSASFTSSSLNGLIIASIFFTRLIPFGLSVPARGRSRIRRACPVRPVESVRCPAILHQSRAVPIGESRGFAEIRGGGERACPSRRQRRPFHCYNKSAVRRGRKECVTPLIFGWSAEHIKKKTT